MADPAPAETPDADPETGSETLSLGRTVAQYSLMRVLVFAAVYAAAALVLVPTLGSRSGWLDAGLVAVVVSLPIAYRMGRPMRENVTDVIDQRRAASKQRDAADRARIESARRNRDSEQNQN